MTIDEAIKHAEEVAEEHESDLKVYENLGKDRELFKKEENNCKECGEQHRQLAEWLKELKRLKEQELCEDIMAIHTQGLDEEIRCIMCTNSMKSDRGCDGGCMIDEDVYEKVMDIIRNRFVSSVTPTHKKGRWTFDAGYPDSLICNKCRAKFDVWHWEQKQMHYCPNCGVEMESEE